MNRLPSHKLNFSLLKKKNLCTKRTDDASCFWSFNYTTQMRMNVRPSLGSVRTGAASTPGGAIPVSAMTASQPAPTRMSASVSTDHRVLL